MTKKPNNLFKQDLLTQLISEYGYLPDEVNNAKPRDLIDKYLNSAQINIDTEALICLINGAYNIDIDKRYN